jgi:hypothetical protein
MNNFEQRANTTTSYESLPPISLTSRIGQDSLEKAVLGERPIVNHDPISIERSPNQNSDTLSEPDMPWHQPTDAHETGSPSEKSEDEAQSETRILSVRDHLTNPETLDFWRRYFHSDKDIAVPTDDFCEAIRQEVNGLVIKPALNAIKDEAVAEDILAEFYEDLSNRISIDQKTVSLNALEIFTRNKGLVDSVRDLLQDCVSRNKQ